MLLWSIAVFLRMLRRRRGPPLLDFWWERLLQGVVLRCACRTQIFCCSQSQRIGGRAGFRRHEAVEHARLLHVHDVREQLYAAVAVNGDQDVCYCDDILRFFLSCGGLEYRGV